MERISNVVVKYCRSEAARRSRSAIWSNSYEVGSADMRAVCTAVERLSLVLNAMNKAAIQAIVRGRICSERQHRAMK